jgi:hypothetical protein
VNLRWGLVPSWAKDAKIGYKLINARADIVADKPSFRSAFKSRRCLIPADGFFEWQKTGGKQKQPFHITLRDGGPFAFAGLWERWYGEDGDVQSCSIVTTDAIELMRLLPDRMPVILDLKDYAAWLDQADCSEPSGLGALSAAWPVTTGRRHGCRSTSILAKQGPLGVDPGFGDVTHEAANQDLPVGVGEGEHLARDRVGFALVKEQEDLAKLLFGGDDSPVTRLVILGHVLAILVANHWCASMSRWLAPALTGATRWRPCLDRQPR